ncbi:signal peptidase II [Orrella sp. 11846]|uniref:signal peptidase II n=1 Tax=Orrella sp. 11846 TaxID=3409913 RepID=UPI003B58B924
MAKWLRLAGLVIVLDQLSKWVIVANLTFAQRIPLLPFFDLTLLYNKGAAFSFLAESSGWQRLFFIAVAFIAIAVILVLMRRHAGQTRFLLALSLILGGAIGNVIDRIFLGHVVDFILLHWDGWYYPAFNIADSAITLGAILLIWDEWRRWRQSKTKSPSQS